MINLPALREWQVIANEQINNNRDKHNVIASFTGAGKGTLALHIIKERLLQNKKCLFVVHSLSILNDIIAKAADMGFKFGVVQGDNTRDINEQFIIASTLSLVKRNLKFDVLIFDEAHHIYNSLINYIEKHPTMEIISFTATPFNPKMSLIFNNVISPITASQLTKDGVLVPLRLKIAKQINTSNISLKGGEFIDTDIEREGNKILGDTVKFWEDNASDRKTIIFASTIAHAEAIANEFVKSNIQAHTYCANTPESIRLELIKKFKDPEDKLMILTTVSALSTGFDAPIASCIISCRPLSKSFSSFVQMTGRILRSYPNKKDALYIDCDGNFDRFGEEYVELFNNGVSSLSSHSRVDKINRHKAKKKKDKIKECPRCNSSMLIADQCFACGFVFIKPKIELDHITKGVELVDRLIGESTNNDKNQLIWKMACASALTSKNPIWRAKFIYRDITGHMPPDNWRFNPADTINDQFRKFVKHRDIKFLKSKGR